MWYFTIHQQLPYMLRHTPDKLFMPTGLMAWWPKQHAVELAVDFVSHTRGLLISLWFFAAIGLGGRWPLLFTGMLFFVHYGLFKASSGTSHAWHIPLFTMLILGFFTRPGEWSTDGLLHRYVRHYPFSGQIRGHLGWVCFQIGHVLFGIRNVCRGCGKTPVWRLGLVER